MVNLSNGIVGMVTKLFSQKIASGFEHNFFENSAWNKGRACCGIDEVGRGCLAGPLVSAAVIVPPGKQSVLLKDSKVLTEVQRVHAYNWIVQHCWCGIGIVDNYTIDRHNIWQATLISMKKALLHALSRCPFNPVSILVDAMPLQLFDTDCADIPVYYFNKGENKSCSIAAASILAKVKRDALMDKFDAIFPGFKLLDNKGYGTAQHKRVLKDGSLLIIHRKSFLNRVETHGRREPKDECNGQQTIGSY